jgi:hypothetical protein
MIEGLARRDEKGLPPRPEQDALDQMLGFCGEPFGRIATNT